jgi:rhodanese-related sulfurtransferase
MRLAHVQESIFEQLARIGQALSSPHRLRLLGLLAQSEKPVERLAEQTDQSVASASAHLKVLRSANLVETRREGRHVYCRVATESVLRFWLAMRQLACEQLPEMRELVRLYFDDPQSLAKLSDEELLRQARAGNIIVLDVRPADEYRAGHFPGSRSIPLAELDRHVSALPKKKPIVAYCRGPYCVAALEACQFLRDRGYQVLRLPTGVAEWRAAGRELETTSKE